MHQSVHLIANKCPTWANATQSGNGLDIDATVVDDSGRPMPTVQLRVWADSRVRIKERDPHRWPIACPERHIEAAGTFCLGKGDPLSPKNNREVGIWWDWLRQFLISQFFADKERYWPSGRGLHHGKASDIQLKMEELARGTILEEDVRQALEEGRGWLAESLPRLTKDRKRLTNLCAPCPRGCFKRKAPLPKGIHRKKHPIIRGNCREKGLVHSIIRLEFDRRKCEAEFWYGHPRKVCCGTMVNCPLARDLQ